MRTNNNIIKMVEAIRGKNNGAAEDNGNGIHMAVVTSVEPLAIRMHNQSITGNLFLNPALVAGASNSGEKMQKIFQTPFETPEAYEFLKGFHEKFVLRKGDTVLVYMAGPAFYVMGKVDGK